MKYVYRFFFQIKGWHIEGDVPRDLRKYIIIVAPHTSNWDFLVGLAVRSILGFKANYLGKKELFRPPFGWLFYKLGGYPVDRSKHSNLVDQVVEICNRENDFVLAIAPEGTRKNKGRWKTGFYHIAHQANIPIVMSSFDYGTKTVSFAKPFFASGNFESDAEIIQQFYNGKTGLNGKISPINVENAKD